ncbi:tryptophan-rich sensory protein [Lichenicoccus roseus]|uniref:Tryptophan-rich sensory protein n=1 Tax=Lichenicoccus roseus TaxID=2683649 RepID=A0A5R9JAQ6_9PROT|nr:tryptophan-rich sensory protein [Lichenicoccus roseus]
MKRVGRDVVTTAICVTAVLGVGGALTSIGPWYQSLRTPRWQPPGWAFGPAWTTIGTLTGIAAVWSWRRAETRPQRRRLMTLFALNGSLNILWSALFFKFRRPDLALVETVPLWLSILALMLGLPRGRNSTLLSALTTWLLLPYLVWVTIASQLNRAVVRLNPPFSGQSISGASASGTALRGPVS